MRTTCPNWCMDHSEVSEPIIDPSDAVDVNTAPLEAVSAVLAAPLNG